VISVVAIFRAVPKRGDLPPEYGWDGCLAGVRDAPGGFAEHLECADEGESKLFVGIWFCAGGGGRESLGDAGHIDDVADEG
jgi:hypothetical protein